MGSNTKCIYNRNGCANPCTPRDTKEIHFSFGLPSVSLIEWSGFARFYKFLRMDVRVHSFSSLNAREQDFGAVVVGANTLD